MSTSNPAVADDTPRVRTAGIVLLVCAILPTVAVSLDPMASGHGPLAVMQSMVANRQVHQYVHVVAMSCVAGLLYAYTVLSQQLGLRRTPVLIGLICYGLGAMLMLIATVIDGFISTDMAAMFVGKSTEGIQIGYWLVQVVENIVLTDIARISWVLESVAVVGWSVALLADGGFRRKIGALGMVAGLLPAAAVIVAGAQMDTTVVVGVLLLQAIWNIAAAVLMLRSKAGQNAAAAPRVASAY